MFVSVLILVAVIGDVLMFADEGGLWASALVLGPPLALLAVVLLRR